MFLKTELLEEFATTVALDKGDKFLKKLWCLVGGSITMGLLLFGFINWVDNVN